MDCYSRHSMRVSSEVQGSSLHDLRPRPAQPVAGWAAWISKAELRQVDSVPALLRRRLAAWGWLTVSVYFLLARRKSRKSQDRRVTVEQPLSELVEERLGC